MSTKEPLEHKTPASQDTERDWDDLSPAIRDRHASAPRGTVDSLLRARRAESGLEEQEEFLESARTVDLAGDAPHSGRPDVPATENNLADQAPAGPAQVFAYPVDAPVTAGEEKDSVTGTSSDTQQSLNEAEERASAREIAVEDRPRLLGMRKFIIACAVPILTVACTVRAVATSGFLWFSYHRPGFPEDAYGLSTDDRMSLGSYVLDYILNFAPASYLAQLRNDKGVAWFLPTEVEHMTDVKVVMLTVMVVATLTGVMALLSARTLSERAPGAIRKSLFAGSWATLGILTALALVAALGWESFFTNFHHLFFPQGNWQFRMSDTLIRLYPPQFWVDAGVTVAAFTLVITAITLVISWPTKLRKARENKIAADRREMHRKLSS